MGIEIKAPLRVMVADDEEDMLRICSDVLESRLRVDQRESDVQTAHNGNSARQSLLREKFDLIILDVQMPGVSGLELMHFALEHGRGAPVVLITAYPNYADAVTAVKEGAFDYVVKPFTAVELVKVAERALESTPLANGESANGDAQPLREILGISPGIQELRSLVQRIALLDENVVLSGETGVGKGLVARVLHASGNRRHDPFVPFDCGAIPRELMESELFGHEKGAFTGATGAREGLLEVAADGTLFLDEVSEIPLDLQSRLLRALHEREFRRVGGTQMKSFRGRVIAASNRDLETAVQKGSFRSDLYYRLHVIPVTVPPLREHPEDIRLLASASLSRFTLKNPLRPVRSISAEALSILKRYGWPGNVRELENVIRRAAVFAETDELRAVDLPEEIRTRTVLGDENQGDFGRARERWLSQFEERYFRDLLMKTAGNVVDAARSSGVPRATLYRYLRRHGLDPAHFRVLPVGRSPSGETDP